MTSLIQMQELCGITTRQAPRVSRCEVFNPGIFLIRCHSIGTCMGSIIPSYTWTASGGREAHTHTHQARQHTTRRRHKQTTFPAERPSTRTPFHAGLWRTPLLEKKSSRPIFVCNFANRPAQSQVLRHLKPASG